MLEHIERDLLDGWLGPGDRLASERGLAAGLGVGRSSVRETLRVFEVMGLIRTATGSGPQAGAVVIATPTDGMSMLLRLQVAAHGFALDDVVRTRLVLEGAVVAPPASAETRDTATMHWRLGAMDAADLTSSEFLALDAQLHLALAEASGNVVVAMMAGLRTAIEGYVRVAAASIADWGSLAERLRAEHRAVAAAIDAGDAELARTLVRAHISDYYDATGLTRDG